MATSKNVRRSQHMQKLLLPRSKTPLTLEQFKQTKAYEDFLASKLITTGLSMKSISGPVTRSFRERLRQKTVLAKIESNRIEINKIRKALKAYMLQTNANIQELASAFSKEIKKSKSLYSGRKRTKRIVGFSTKHKRNKKV